jgi:ABC-type amino acid transport substrate-binding protein
MAGDPEAYPGMLIENDLLGGRVDAVVLWGPIAGYYAGRARDVTLTVVPLVSEPPDIQFEFSTSAGVRYADEEGKAEIDGLIEQTRAEIAGLLAEFHFPLVE